MDLFRIYMYFSIIVFVCLAIIFLISPESFRIG